LFFVSLLAFLGLALIAIIKYPGKDLDQDAFSMIHDYWCDLYKRETPSGKKNGGMLFAKLGTITAALSFGAFWTSAPMYFIEHKAMRIITQALGVLALSIAVFLFSGYHDTVISLGSLFGFLALFLFVISLKGQVDSSLFFLGIIVIVFLVACNILLLLPEFFFILPVFQKLAMCVAIIWTVLIAKLTLKLDLKKNLKH